MNKKKIIKIVSILFILIAVINLGCLITLNLFEKFEVIYTNLSIFVGILQIAIIIISIIMLKKNINFKLTMSLMIIASLAIIGTFFIPVREEEENHRGRNIYAPVPKVMPNKYYKNLYNIKLKDLYDIKYYK